MPCHAGGGSNCLKLVQGPPGTGKTAVAIKILKHWARVAQARVRPGGEPTANPCHAGSNIAVNNLVEGCTNVGLHVVRLSRPKAIHSELLQYCIDGSSADKTKGGGVAIPASLMKEKMKILKNAQVVCCRCIGSGGDILDNDVQAGNGQRGHASNGTRRAGPPCKGMPSACI